MLTFEITQSTGISITYHVRALLSTRDSIHYFLSPTDRQLLTTLGTDLMQRISNVPGVEDLVIGRYRFRITKAQAFTWAEVREAIESILTAD
jgi:Mg2+/Co2+ transporter CorC